MSIPTLEKEESRLISAVDNARKIRDTLKLKLEHARVSREVEIEQQSNRFTIIDPPLVPTTRYKPVRKMYLIAGVAGGIVLAFAAVFVLEFVDPRIIRLGELQRKFAAPILGRVTRAHRARLIDKVGRRGLARIIDLIQSTFLAKRLVLPDGFPPNLLLTPDWIRRHAESESQGHRGYPALVAEIRTIGVNARLAFDDKPGLVLAVASAKPQEGKTTIAANLAVTLAADLEQSVLLIDGNPENPTITQALATPDAPGFGNVLAGTSSVADCATDSATSDLHILPIGHCQDLGGTLLRTDRVDALIEEARRDYAFVVVEIQSLVGSSAATVLANACDGVIMVTKAYDTKKASITAALKEIDDQHLVGFVANHTEHWLPDWLYRLV